MSIDCEHWTVASRLPQYTHHEVVIGSVVVLVLIVGVAVLTLLIIWGRRGR